MKSSGRLFSLLFAVSFSLFFLTACNKKAVPLIKHAPVQNPQGIAFNTDQSFVKAYNQYLTNKARLEYASQGGLANTSNGSSIYNIKNIDHLKGAKIINPTEANWNVNYIAPPERHSDKVVKTLKNFIDIRVKNVKSVVAPPNSTSINNKINHKINHKNNNRISHRVDNSNSGLPNNKIVHMKATPSTESQTHINKNTRNRNRNNIFHTYINKKHTESHERSSSPNTNRSREKLERSPKDISARPIKCSERLSTKERISTSPVHSVHNHKNSREVKSLAKNKHTSTKQKGQKFWQPWHDAAVKNSAFFTQKKTASPKAIQSSHRTGELDLKKELASLKTKTGKRIVDCRHGKEIMAKTKSRAGAPQHLELS